MSQAKEQPAEIDLGQLEQLVAEADTGGRQAAGLAGQVLLWVAVAWSLFQLWYASPLPFVFGFGVLNDTEATMTIGRPSARRVASRRSRMPTVPVTRSSVVGWPGLWDRST